MLLISSVTSVATTVITTLLRRYVKNGKLRTPSV